MNILEAIDHPHVFGAALKNPASWKAWRAFLATLFALPMDEDGEDVFRQCTNRKSIPQSPFSEAWLVCGRRAGKSYMMALIAVFLACFRSYDEFLAIGERGTVFIIASDKKQARNIMRYIRGLLALPAFSSGGEKKILVRETVDAFDLNNRVSIEVGTASHKSVRGYTIVAALCDEIAFWMSEDSASPDFEILDALRPAMGTIPGAMLICASSPYARKGVMWDAFQRYFGKDDAPVLVWKAPTATMNPSFPLAILEEAMERDRAKAESEYLAEFRKDIETFIPVDVVEAAVVPGRFELPPVLRSGGDGKQFDYVAFVDPAGGSGADAMTLAVAHMEDDIVVLDLLREERPPFSPERVVADFVAVLARYGLSKVVGDRWGGEFVREQFTNKGISYSISERVRSDIYRELLPLMNSRRVELLDNKRLITQICGLERRTARGGRDSIDHATGSHDDAANACAGALVLAAVNPTGFSVENFIKAYG